MKQLLYRLPKPFQLTLLAVLLAVGAHAQEKLPVIAPYNYLNLREAYMDSLNVHTAVRPLLHEDTSAMYTRPDTTKRSWIYRKLFREHLFEFRTQDYNVFVDFLPDFQVGKSRIGSKTTWLNTRGASVKGNIGKNFYFETTFFENQGVFPYYLDSFMRKMSVVPGQGSYKLYQDGKGFDYSNVSALLAYTPNKYLSMAAGYGQNFIGDGHRSLLLSDNQYSYPYLKLTGTLGKFQYTAIWAQFMDRYALDFGQAYHDIGYPKKWGVFHYLDWNVSKKLSIGVFDAVIWPDADSSGRKRGFDWSYMNPIIFLRPAEFSEGSSDNAVLGANAKFKLATKTTMYGQLVLDEFKLKEMVSGKGWWANKWGVQLGIKSYDVFRVKGLDVQGEFNTVRPYTYSYRNTATNYAHYNQSLAHPLGANFRELLGIASYRLKRWYVRGELMWSQYGIDPDSKTNYGQNIYKPYLTYVNVYGNHIAQGIKTDLLYGQGVVAYVLNPKNNLRVEMSVTGRSEKNNVFMSRDLIFNIGLRSSFRQFAYDF
ncbi:hypothetical protein SAMN04488128_1021566 [Chitinophaga eiseniae]|uniref:Capsule assembly protein Wzi n=1 Tax=Chitinophaga eiseniae TaxID=634771 RepID=A0A1T4RX03_9BACT|nr:hypothetical protein [Chitinophaga eiseniae]SKA20492.1 hypothetical protein SAMN04488128_1021566 [Chitinophaga eiseniae]